MAPQSSNKSMGIVSDKEQKKRFFSLKIQEHMDAMYSFAFNLSRKREDAEDLVAEAASKAWLKLDSLEDPSKFRPWIFRIIHNGYISQYRKKSIRPEEPLLQQNNDADDSEVASLLIQQPNEFLIWWANPEKAVINELLQQDLIAAINQLPQSYRATVILINIEGMSYDEAAQVLQVSPGTVRSRMNRGRTLLQKALWQHALEAGLICNNSLEYSS